MGEGSPSESGFTTLAPSRLIAPYTTVAVERRKMWADLILGYYHRKCKKSRDKQKEEV